MEAHAVPCLMSHALTGHVNRQACQHEDGRSGVTAATFANALCEMTSNLALRQRKTAEFARQPTCRIPRQIAFIVPRRQ